MADINPAAALNSDECREPTVQDLVNLCRALNQAGARYIVVGGFAVRAAGYTRTTLDIDLLIEVGLENEARVIQGMMSLPDQAIKEIAPGEVDRFGVVRVADEILVDLMKSGCGIDYAEAKHDAVVKHFDGVPIPFASPKTLWRMKQTVRAKDIPDRLFLKELLKAQGIDVDLPQVSKPAESNRTVWQRLTGWFRGS